MKLKVLTWNVGGGKILADNEDPNLLKSYSEDGFKHIIDVIKQENPDVIALQETHKNDKIDWVNELASVLKYDFYVHDSTSASHIDEDYNLGHAIISKFSLNDKKFKLFKNPNITIDWEDGSRATSFDKGITSVKIYTGNEIIEFTTLHLIPFRRFNIELNSKIALKILNDVDKSFLVDSPISIIAGDFNINKETVSGYFNSLKDNYNEIQINEPTTPKNHIYDHVMYKGLTLVDFKVIKEVKTDHFPIVANFQTNN